MANRNVYLDQLREARGGRMPIDQSIHPQVVDRLFAVASDWHVPYHDDEMIARMLERCADEHIETLVAPGDTFDMPYFSSFDVDTRELDLEKDFACYRGIIETMFQVFKQIIILPGNHDDRYFRQLKWQTGMDGLLRHAGLTEYIEDGTLKVYNDPTIMAMDDTWMITHPYAFGRHPGIIPGQIADLHQVNVMSAHSHHWNLGRSPSGKFIVVETGGLFKPEYTGYKMKKINPLRPWVRGYWILRDGIPVPGY